MRERSSSVSGSAYARQRTGIRERLLSGSKGPITMFSSDDGDGDADCGDDDDDDDGDGDGDGGDGD